MRPGDIKLIHFLKMRLRRSERSKMMQAQTHGTVANQKAGRVILLSSQPQQVVGDSNASRHIRCGFDDRCSVR